MGNKTELLVKITGSNCGNPLRNEIKSAPSAGLSAPICGKLYFVLKTTKRNTTKFPMKTSESIRDYLWGNLRPSAGKCILACIATYYSLF